MNNLFRRAAFCGAYFGILSVLRNRMTAPHMRPNFQHATRATVCAGGTVPLLKIYGARAVFIRFLLGYGYELSPARSRLSLFSGAILPPQFVAWVCPALNGGAGDSIVIRLSCFAVRRRRHSRANACGLTRSPVGRSPAGSLGGSRTPWAWVSKRARGREPTDRFPCVRFLGLSVRFRARGKSPRVFPKGKERDFSRPLCCRF